MNAARWFQRREDYQPPQTPADSPFRRFTVSCLKCGSFKLKVLGEFDSDAGELKILLFCPSCREREQLPVCQVVVDCHHETRIREKMVDGAQNRVETLPVP